MQFRTSCSQKCWYVHTFNRRFSLYIAKRMPSLLVEILYVLTYWLALPRPWVATPRTRANVWKLICKKDLVRDLGYHEVALLSRPLHGS